MRRYVEIEERHVGEPLLRAFGKLWPVSSFIGWIRAKDVGKRVYLVDGILQVENDDQLAKRRNKTCAKKMTMTFSVANQGGDRVMLESDRLCPLKTGHKGPHGFQMRGQTDKGFCDVSVTWSD